MGRNKNNKCCIVCRRRRTSDSHVTLFKFPDDTDRCRAWIQRAGLIDLIQLPIEMIQKNRFICESHFSPSSFKTTRRRLLEDDAIPTINLEYPPLPDELFTEFPLHQHTENANAVRNVLKEHNYGVIMRRTTQKAYNALLEHAYAANDNIENVERIEQALPPIVQMDS